MSKNYGSDFMASATASHDNRYHDERKKKTVQFRFNAK